jgi:hypothetical protein
MRKDWHTGPFQVGTWSMVAERDADLLRGFKREAELGRCELRHPGPKHSFPGGERKPVNHL